LCWVLGAEGKRSVEKIRSEGPYPAEQTDILKTSLLKKLKISGANVSDPLSTPPLKALLSKLCIV